MARMKPQAPPGFDLFVLHATADREFVRGYLLPALNLSPGQVQILDELPPGTLTASKIDSAISRSRYTVAVLSPAYLSDRWALFGEQLASYLSVEDARIIPLRLAEMKLPLRLEARVSLDFTDRSRWASEAGRLRGLLGTAAPRSGYIPCPYPGMRSFAAIDAKRFFGRDAEINDLIDRLDRGDREIYVIGPSGSGKSSLIEAGLLPRLSAGSSRLEHSFLVTTMRPDQRPTERFTAALEALKPLETAPTIQRALVFVDQLEELFTLTGPQERERFIEMIHMMRRERHCYLVFALRADFYGALMDSPLWPASGGISRLDVAALRGPALAEAITAPAVQVGVYLEARLCDRLVMDAAAEPGALPLVQEILRQLWERRCQRLLGLSEYEAFGGGGSGLHIAIARRADATMDALTAAQQTMARRVLIRLVSFGEGRPDTRRQQKLAMLRSAGDHEMELSSVLQHMIDNRLITVGGDTGSKDTIVDLSHEALITAWPSFQHLIARRRVDELRRRRLEAKVDEWIERGRGGASLLAAVELLEAEQWLRSDAARELGYRIELAELMAASRKALDRAGQEARDAQRLLATTYLEHGRSLLVDGRPMQALPYLVAARAAGIETFVIRMLFAQAARALPVATFIGAGAFSSDGTRVTSPVPEHGVQVLDTRTGVATSQVLVHPSKPNVEALGSDGARMIVSYRKEPTEHFWLGRFQPHRENPWKVEIWNTLYGCSANLPLSDEGTFNSVAISRNGNLVLMALLNNTAQLYNASTGASIVPPLCHGGMIYSARFNHDDTRAVTASADGTARIWDLATGESIAGPLEHRGPVRVAAFSFDDMRVMTASADQTARIWDASTGHPLTPPLQHQGPVVDAAFSPDGHRVATASVDHTARVWGVSASGVTGGPILEHQAPVSSVTFSPSGLRVATASADKIVRLWDVATGAPIAVPFEHPAPVHAAAFSSDGTHVLTTDAHKTVRVWDASVVAVSKRSLQRGKVHDAKFSPDGARIVAALSDQTARVWDAATGTPITPPLAHEGAILFVAFSLDGSRVVTASADRTTRIWDASNGTPITPPLEHKAEVCIARFDAACTRVVTASLDNTVRIWSISTGEPLIHLLAHRDFVRTVEFSTDGTRVLTASTDKTARIWDAVTGRPIGWPLKHRALVWAAAFSSDGTRVITASADNTARIWDASTGRPTTDALEHGGEVQDAAFSADGTRAITASFDNTARVWDALTGKPMLRPLEHRDLVFSAAFSPDGTLLVTASRDQTARVWDASTGNPVTVPLRHPAYVQSARFSPDGNRILTTCIDRSALLWELAVDTRSLDDWRTDARCCPFVLLDNVLVDNRDPRRFRMSP